MKFLVIEDDEQARQTLVDQLMAQNVGTVYEAGDTARALEFIRDADAIVCDDASPVLDGEPPFHLAWWGLRDAAEALRKPFVLLTGDLDTLLEALHEETDAHLKEHAAEAIGHLVQLLGKGAAAA
jgi:CheY-like chemotaxis protein